MKIILTGGGSGGSVAPLLAVAETIKAQKPNVKFLFIGGKNGPEKQMAEAAGIDFVVIQSGKLRRYFSISNLFSPILVLAGFISAFKFLKKFKPNAVFGAGSFVQVPVIWAAWLLKIPSVIHQQDIEPSLANKLCEPVASKITVCFEKSLSDFFDGLGIFYKKSKSHKVELTGNPFRRGLLKEQATKTSNQFGFNEDMPILLVMGGGTGSSFINRLIKESLPELTKIIQVLHILGERDEIKTSINNYHAARFISDMAAAYSIADFVISRAGLSSIAELSALGKVSIIIPMPKTHQEYNAELLAALKSAIVLNQKNVNKELLVRLIRKLMFDYKLQKMLSKNISKIMPKDSDTKIADIIIKAAKI